MILCESLTLHPWRPDFSSAGLSSPHWTRVRCDGAELMNSVEGIAWEEGNPVQVILCEECGCPGCATGNYVHMSTLADHVVWTRPLIEELDQDESWRALEITPPLVLEQHGIVATPVDQWARLRKINATVPGAEQLPRITRRALADGWQMSAPRPHRAQCLEAVIPLLEDRLAGTEHLQKEETIALLAPLIGWLSANPGRALEGRICQAEAMGADIERLYFTDASQFHWPAIALHQGRALLALSDDLVYVPGGQDLSPAF
jgi:hypothetical protein